MLLVGVFHFPIELLQYMPQTVRHRIEFIAKFFLQEGKKIIRQTCHASRCRETDDHRLLRQLQEPVFGGTRFREVRELRPLPMIIAVLKFRQRVARKKVAIHAKFLLQEGFPGIDFFLDMDWLVPRIQHHLLRLLVPEGDAERVQDCTRGILYRVASRMIDATGFLSLLPFKLVLGDILYIDAPCKELSPLLQVELECLEEAANLPDHRRRIETLILSPLIPLLVVLVCIVIFDMDEHGIALLRILEVRIRLANRIVVRCAK